MLDHVLRYIAPGAVSLTLPNRQLSSLKGAGSSWMRLIRTSTSLA
jgi:tRNA threonylcarbamoyladenosine modification (KEOPS) complex  Pcc1 subunit